MSRSAKYVLADGAEEDYESGFSWSGVLIRQSCGSDSGGAPTFPS